MTLCRAFWASFIVYCLGVFTASASVLSLDFNSVDYNGGSVLNVGLASIENLDGESFFVYGTGQFGMPAPGGFCALNVVGDCKGDARITFTKPITDLTFSSLYVSGGDGTVLRAMVDGVVAKQFFVKSESTIDLSDLGGITEITLYDVSGVRDRGIAFGGFHFTEYVIPADTTIPKDTTVIPLPAGLPLLVSALLSLGLGRLRTTSHNRA